MDNTAITDTSSDFAALLAESDKIMAAKRGDILTGIVIHIDAMGALVDVNLKRDGVVPRNDLESMGDALANLTPGDEIDVMVVHPEDRDGNLILSAHRALQNIDWKRAEELMAESETYYGEVSAANKGGLIVPFGNLRGFVPASHVASLPRDLNEEERIERLSAYIGGQIDLKIIEVSPSRRRLVLSQREAQRADREKRKQELMDVLQEGDTYKGTVTGFRDFGAFVDLGGADGLIHISELAWHRVNHPSEILNAGDEIDVYILRLDKERNRIGLSLKRLEDNPWERVDELYAINQLIEGTVTRIVTFGAFVELDTGIEALLHISQISDPPPEDPRYAVLEGQRLLLRIVSIESERQRMGLSLKAVSDEELNEWEDKIEAERAAESEEDQPENDAQDVVQFEDAEDNEDTEDATDKDNAIDNDDEVAPEEVAVAELDEAVESDE